eukprot:4114960-Amphidinium_carterae.1
MAKTPHRYCSGKSANKCAPTKTGHNILGQSVLVMPPKMLQFSMFDPPGQHIERDSCPVQQSLCGLCPPFP